MESQEKGRYTLEVPLDAGDVEGDRSGALKVLAVGDKGILARARVTMDPKGMATAMLAFAERPGAMKILVGPDEASDEELPELQTLTHDLPQRVWKAPQLKLPPLRIKPIYWHAWRRFCRTYTIEGRVVCADGRPAPGVRVTAFDVDRFWWWHSRDQVASATTDATGAFTMKFRWCCGLRPIYWLKRRTWEIDHEVAKELHPALRSLGGKAALLAPSPKPDLAIFDELLDQPAGAARRAPTTEELTELRAKLVPKLPRPELVDKLRLWPYWPWQPWFDCSPDIVFSAVQVCDGKSVTVVNEGLSATRYDIPTTLSVTLVAEGGCCIGDEQRPEGNCVLLDAACGVSMTRIGGNPGATAAPVGFVDPGVLTSNYADRPFAGTISVSGSFGSGASVDYYEIEWSDDGGASWNGMPDGDLATISRAFWGAPLTGTGPVGQQQAPFAPSRVDGRLVYETIDHFEANNGAGTWSLSRFWMSQELMTMAHWLTGRHFGKGLHQLRLVAYDLAGTNLVNRRILPLCATENENGLSLYLDNRAEPDSAHPLGPSHPSGSGTVHVATTEPDTDIVAVRVGGSLLAGCSELSLSGGDVTIDFIAHDPAGRLAEYSLLATYGENYAVNLLSLIPASPGPGDIRLEPSTTPFGAVAPASQVGPGYAAARAQGASAPDWRGGALRLVIPAARIAQAFPEKCCYQLELRAYKRTIVSCYGGAGYANLTQYNLLVTA